MTALPTPERIEEIRKQTKAAIEMPYWPAPASEKYAVLPADDARDLLLALDAAQAENTRLREALTEIIKDAPTEKPEQYDFYTGNPDDHAEIASEQAHYFLAQIARTALTKDPA